MKYLMKLKKSMVVLFLVSVLLLPAYASATPKAKAEADQQRVDNLKERANREVERRITTLNKLVSQISSIKKLTPDQKTAFSSEIQKNVSDLSSLKAKIGAETDLATVKSDVKSIVDSYKIFGVFMPKIHLLAAVNKTEQAQIKLSTIATRLETQISTLKTVGKDVAGMEADLAEMKAKLTDAKTKITALQAKIIAVTTDGYPGNKGVLVDGKNDLAEIKKDLATARTDAKKIVNAIKSLNSDTSAETKTKTEE
jgi:septal ring factor EnvC (AmiA/AmiB activator)